MKSVNIAELKNRLSAYLNEVRGGEEIIVRDRHTPVAKIIPFRPAADPGDELLALAAQDKVRLGGGELGEAFWKLPRPHVAGKTLKEIMDEERND